MKVRRAVSLSGIVAAAWLAGGGGSPARAAPPATPSLWDNIRAAEGIVLARVEQVTGPRLGQVAGLDRARAAETIGDIEIVSGEDVDIAEGEDSLGAEDTEDTEDTEVTGDTEDTEDPDVEEDAAEDEDVQSEEPGVVPDALMVVLRFEVQETWKGAPLSRFEVRVPIWETREQGCTPGRTMVAFLSRENGALTASRCL